MSKYIIKIAVCEYKAFLSDFIQAVEAAVPSVKVLGIPRENLPEVLSQLTDQLPSIKWAHSTWAGVETVFFPKPQFVKKPLFEFTKAGGFFGPLMTEWIIGQIISWERKFRNCHKWQNLKIWGKHEIGFYRPLPRLSIGILGLGDIGRDVARAYKFFKMTVGAMVRRETSMGRCEFVDHYRNCDGLADILKSCDYICSILPKTSETDDMLEGDRLKICTKKPVLINVGRSNIISEASIIKALDLEWISGAILDVFNEEPLPSSSPLWNHKKVTISPHVSAASLPKETANAFVINLKKYLEGQPLLYKVDWESRY